ncbi:PTS sugar transporter subunit IIA [Companilactobacillus zhachilii]|uniref:PTS sugar transporter subunit IIA n=1 Tax=Companilactobacillus zhachilii TaxID=2304606 RepID=UPI0019223954|nr:fructose PTS transporter subunit IIA [Companilactobacillus zhachilii]MBL3530756.1 PTS sugar transporter subunit IIA [Companilactobacillus zhachilii]
MEILDLLNKNQMNFNIEADTKENVIREMAKMFLKDGVITDIDKYVESVMEREETGTTGVGGGIAIPHGKSEVVKTSSIAFAKLSRPVAWDALDGKDVSMVFMLSIPGGSESKEHLRVLSLLAQRLMDDDVIDALKVAKTKDDIINIFKNKEIAE